MSHTKLATSFRSRVILSFLIRKHKYKKNMFLTIQTFLNKNIETITLKVHLN